MSQEKKKLYASIIFRIFAIMTGLVGLIENFQGRDEFMSNPILYFTVQSNIWAVALFVITLVLEFIRLTKGAYTPPEWFSYVRFAFSTAIMLTFLVFSGLLTPALVSIGMSSYLLTATNIICHYVTPLLTVFDFFFYDFGENYGKKSFWSGLVMPVYYLGFWIVCVLSGVRFVGIDGAESVAPYFFLDFEANGWLSIGDGKIGVVYWMIIVLLLIIGMSFGTYKLKQLILKKQGK